MELLPCREQKRLEISLIALPSMALIVNLHKSNNLFLSLVRCSRTCQSQSYFFGFVERAHSWKMVEIATHMKFFTLCMLNILLSSKENFR